MQTITTTYIGPTNTKPSRIKATYSGGTLSVILSGSVVAADGSVIDAERAAVRQLMDKLGWTGEMIGGSLSPDKTVWVFAESKDRVEVGGRCPYCHVIGNGDHLPDCRYMVDADNAANERLIRKGY